MQIPGIYVEIKGDSDHLRKEMRTANAYVQQQAKGISDALNNALSPTQVKRGVNDLVRNFKTLNQASVISDRVFGQIGVDLKEMRHLTGLSEKELQKLQSRMLKNRAANLQQRALRDIARSADLTKKEIAQLGRQFGLSATQIRKVNSQLGRMPKRLSLVRSMTRSVYANVLALASVWAAISGVQSLARISDEYTNINSKLRLVTDSSKEFNDVYSELFAISQETGSSFSSNALKYANLALALQDVDVPARELLQVFEDVNKSLVVAGASTQEVNSFMLQFKQALGANRLAGDEFRGMMESNAYWAGQFAKALGTDIGGLYEMKEAGLLTTNTVLNAHRKMSEEIASDFTQLDLTISRATTQLSNAWKDVFSDGNKASGTSRDIANSISELASTVSENKEEIISVFKGVVKFGEAGVKVIGLLGKSIQGWEMLFEEIAVKLDVARTGADELGESLIRMSRSNKAQQDLRDRLQDIRSEIKWLNEAMGKAGPENAKKYGEEIGRLNREMKAILITIDRMITGEGVTKPGNSAVDELVNRAEAVKDAYKGMDYASFSQELSLMRTSGVNPGSQLSLFEKGLGLSGDDEEKAAQKAIERQITLREDLADKVRKITLSQKDYAVWALNKEVEEMRKTAGESVQINDMISDYHKASLDEILDTSSTFSEDMKNAMTGWASSWSSQLNEMVWDADASFEDILTSFGKMITQMIIQKTIAEPIMEGLGSVVGSLFHTGGIVGAAAAARAVPASVFAGAPRFHSGLMPGEFPAILKKGEGVFTKEQMASLAPAGGATQITLMQTNEINIESSGGSDSDKEKDAEKVAQAIETHMQQWLSDQKRYGGILYNRR